MHAAKAEIIIINERLLHQIHPKRPLHTPSLTQQPVNRGIQLMTCRACGIEPLAYLRHVLTELPQRDDEADITDLLPFNYVKSAAA